VSFIHKTWFDLTSFYCYYVIITITFIQRKLIQYRKCAGQQSKIEQISFQFPAKSSKIVIKLIVINLIVIKLIVIHLIDISLLTINLQHTQISNSTCAS
jgi:hypothetical protein